MSADEASGFDTADIDELYDHDYLPRSSIRLAISRSGIASPLVARHITRGCRDVRIGMSAEFKMQHGCRFVEFLGWGEDAVLGGILAHNSNRLHRGNVIKTIEAAQLLRGRAHGHT